MKAARGCRACLERNSTLYIIRSGDRGAPSDQIGLSWLKRCEEHMLTCNWILFDVGIFLGSHPLVVCVSNT